MPNQTRQAPARGTRPPNRRELIITAATELFHHHGYDSVSMSSVAAAVNVTPTALYRHFRGKPQLLTAAVMREMEPVRQTIEDTQNTDLDTVAQGLARAAVKSDRLGLLWLREARALPSEEYALLRAEVSHTMRLLASLLARHRPELTDQDTRLLTQSLCSVLSSTSTRPQALSKKRYQRVLHDIILAIARLSPEPAQASPPSSQGIGLFPSARRERLLQSALTLWAEYGYTSVGIEDIGSRAGVATSGVYREFESKEHLLAALLARGDEWVRYDMHRALGRASNPDEGLTTLLASYVDFVADHHTYVTILLREARHLTGQAREQSKQTQREYINEWVTLMRTVVPDLPEAEARLRVGIVVNVANDLARTPKLRALPASRAIMKQLGLVILAVPTPVESPAR
ncbi:TetR/AcrR family transcriptional regulator [Nocardiopsis sp. JB363]|uniref:TetR/AcrR family transcriptional regulator n=1 Tax=Nocardiopsis sp. JB363 TaxID=1434837 RepID=UPI00097B9E55|nr:TetR/AcrR family transcriptional regulator [Nocardiopsis sp. JB363]SIO90786.1 Transcriptional regulator, TetR family [Nocardiopsis sp. JB363]